VREHLRKVLAGDIEQGDRVSLGPVDIIVRGVSEEHEIEDVGLSVDPEEPKEPAIPLFQSPRDIINYFRERRRKREALDAQARAVQAARRAADGDAEGEP
jgi:cell volume regulation protein A